MADEIIQRDANRITVAGGVTDNAAMDVTNLRVDPTSKRLKVDALASTSLIGLSAYDYVSLATASTTDTYTFKTGGSGGTTVATITITYTDSTKATISNVART